MRVFVTGASGWIGSAVVDDLLAAGHEVTGLARSEPSATALDAKGAHVRRGDLDDLDSIRLGAKEAEAVIHLANKHDWSNPAASNAAERAAVHAIGDTLVGTHRPFLLASGIGALANGRPATEDDASPFHGPDSPRGGSENLALEFVDHGVHTVSLRFAPTQTRTPHTDRPRTPQSVRTAADHGHARAPGDEPGDRPSAGSSPRASSSSRQSAASRATDATRRTPRYRCSRFNVTRSCTTASLRFPLRITILTPVLPVLVWTLAAG
jgi:nucleoside-diphosphate-sugar epimerase